ncbi:rhomboid family protein [Luteibacter rhizovicinus]|uniref:Rhomboid family protein n=1 Tax=Luteibacter rhizovicinus TaxID=242606 RepID=A0A4R3YKH6_9GAMM|nr:rhomboid family intramembrane serine protease [Luteibacter rhizovicinus]TCV93235.1 rhomboid family protein [Luteibacter rhizovicinus]
MITLLIILVTAVVSILAFRNVRLMNDLILWPPALSRSREYYRLVSYGLVHADGSHLFFNMFTLFFFGRVMEGFYNAHMGPLGFVTFYIGGLVVSILPSYLKNKNNVSYRSLGASGAVSAVLFAFILMAPWTRILVFVIPMPAILYAVLYVAYSIVMERRGGDNVNHSAHLWGGAYGIAVTLLIDPSVFGDFIAQISQPTFR